MLADELRKSILQASVEGRLVQQNEKDEPANILINRILGDKFTPIDKSEQPYELPINWIWVRLMDIIIDKPKNGYSPTAVEYTTKIRNLTLTATTSGIFNDTAFKYVDIDIDDDSLYWLKHNDLLIQRSNSREYVGTSCIYSGEDNAYIYPDLIMRMRVNPLISLEYVDFVLKSPFIRQYYQKNASGTSKSMPKINQNTVCNTLIPLPPVEEQCRIVDKLKTVLFKINEFNEIERQLNLIKTKFPNDLKKAILQYSMQGRLTERHSMDSYVGTLIDEIKQERKRLIKKRLIKSEKIEPITEEELVYDIPNEWGCIRLGECASIYTGNSIPVSVKAQKYSNLKEGYNYIGTKDVGFDHDINYDNGVKIPFNEPNFKYAYPNTTLLCIEGGSAGKKIAILDRQVCFGNKLCAFMPIVINPKFLYYFLQSPQFTTVFTDKITGIIGGVSQGKLKNICIPIPSLEEQQRIVQRLDELLPVCEDLNI